MDRTSQPSESDRRSRTRGTRPRCGPCCPAREIRSCTQLLVSARHAWDCRPGVLPSLPSRSACRVGDQPQPFAATSSSLRDGGAGEDVAVTGTARFFTGIQRPPHRRSDLLCHSWVQNASGMGLTTGASYRFVSGSQDNEVSAPNGVKSVTVVTNVRVVGGGKGCFLHLGVPVLPDGTVATTTTTPAPSAGIARHRRQNRLPPTMFMVRRREIRLDVFACFRLTALGLVALVDRSSPRSASPSPTASSIRGRPPSVGRTFNVVDLCSGILLSPVSFDRRPVTERFAGTATYVTFDPGPEARRPRRAHLVLLDVAGAVDTVSTMLGYAGRLLS